MEKSRKNHCLILITFLILSFVIKTIVYSAYYPVTRTIIVPTLPINQQNPAENWKAQMVRSISFRLINNNYLMVVAYRVTGFGGEAGSGPFVNVSHSFAFDINKDGKPDLINYTYDRRVVVKLNDGNGNFSQNIYDYSFGDFLASVIVDDFDNDGKPDLLGLGGRDGYTALFASNLDRNSANYYKKTSFKSSVLNFDSKIVATSMAAYDFDGDGYKDVIYADKEGRVWWWRNDPSRGVNRFFDESQVFLLIDSGMGPVNRYNPQQAGTVDVKDINYDGIPDIVVGNIQRREIRIYLGKRVNARIEYTIPPIILTDSNGRIVNGIVDIDPRAPNSKSPHYLRSFTPTLLRFADVDGDGFTDLFIATDAWGEGKRYGGALYLFRGNGFTSDGKPKFLSYELSAGNSADSGRNPYDFDCGSVADFDADGLIDFVAADGNHSGNFYKVKTLSNNTYDTSTYGFILSKPVWELIGIPYSQIPSNFVKSIEITIQFEKQFSGQISDGLFEIRYYPVVQNPDIVWTTSEPERWKNTSNLFPGTAQNMRISTVVPANGVYTANVTFTKPLKPDIQILIALKSLSQTTTPGIKKITYKITTAPQELEIRNFQWLNKEY